MRRLMVVGNWKMYGTRASVTALITAILPALNTLKSVDIAVLPPFIFIEQVAQLLTNSQISWGGQNFCSEPEGAYTGEVSAAMLGDFHCRYALVGHSERRSLYGEDDIIVAKKFVLAKSVGLIPILCIGETLQEREAGRTLNVVTRQLQAILELSSEGSALANAVVAYEPVWAIGTGLTATPEQAQEVHTAIRAEVAKHNPSLAKQLTILYGGSVKSANAKQLFAMPDIDGGLIGGASLNAREFIEICSLD